MARTLVAAVAIVAAIAFSAAVMVPGPGSPQRASPGPVLGIANPTLVRTQNRSQVAAHSEPRRPSRPFVGERNAPTHRRDGPGSA